MENKLQALRQKTGLPQDKFAAVTGVNASILRAYERGARDINGARLSTLIAFCKVLNCKIEDIITDEQCIQALQAMYK